ncbi:MAG: hypothetical protein BJ554DRAFT_3093, partial [Olpidium bornovanus]
VRLAAKLGFCQECVQLTGPGHPAARHGFPGFATMQREWRVDKSAAALIPAISHGRRREVTGPATNQLSGLVIIQPAFPHPAASIQVRQE